MGFETLLLGILPIDSEETQHATDNYECLQFVLSLYDKSLENDVTVMLGDNTNMNKACARNVGCYFVGCQSHRCNLDIKVVLSGYKPELEKVHAHANIMV